MTSYQFICTALPRLAELAPGAFAKLFVLAKLMVWPFGRVYVWAKEAPAAFCTPPFLSAVKLCVCVPADEAPNPPAGPFAKNPCAWAFAAPAPKPNISLKWLFAAAFAVDWDWLYWLALPLNLLRCGLRLIRLLVIKLISSGKLRILRTLGFCLGLMCSEDSTTTSSTGAPLEAEK